MGLRGSYCSPKARKTNNRTDQSNGSNELIDCRDERSVDCSNDQLTQSSSVVLTDSYLLRAKKFRTTIRIHFRRTIHVRAKTHQPLILSSSLTHTFSAPKNFGRPSIAPNFLIDPTSDIGHRTQQSTFRYLLPCTHKYKMVSKQIQTKHTLSRVILL